jgi:predicted nucleic-acid-binding protein
MKVATKVPAIRVDTNTVLRHLLSDNSDQSPKASALMEEAERGECLLRIHGIVVAELVWTLDSYYGFSAKRIADDLADFLTAPGIEVDDRANVLSALRSFADKNVDYIDAYLGAVAASEGVQIATFDKHYKRLGVSIRIPGDRP